MPGTTSASSPIDIGEPGQYEALPDPHHLAQPLDGRARSQLAASCAMCHREGGPAGVSLDRRYGLPPIELNAVGVPPSAGDLGIEDPFLIEPGSRATSVL